MICSGGDIQWIGGCGGLKPRREEDSGAMWDWQFLDLFLPPECVGAACSASKLLIARLTLSLSAFFLGSSCAWHAYMSVLTMFQIHEILQGLPQILSFSIKPSSSPHSALVTSFFKITWRQSHMVYLSHFHFHNLILPLERNKILEGMFCVLHLYILL